MVVGCDWWLERHEYDGAESWSYKVLPEAQEERLPFRTVKNGDSRATVSEMNRPGGKYSDA